MKRKVAACPSCGGPVEFRISTSMVTVCEFCNSVVGRADKDLRDHGKVADLVQTSTPLALGLRGTYRRKSFEIVGRVQYRHPAGGVWDEWYLLFSNGRWGWLSDAQGKHHLTFERKPEEGTAVPDFSSLEAGEAFELGKAGRFTVVEKGTATAITADGEIPWMFRPNEELTFADLHAPDGGFATFEYTDDIASGVFIGEEVRLDEIGLPTKPQDLGAFETANTAAVSLNCPHCAGPLTLHAPDETERIACPNCASLLDCQDGKLEYFSTLRMKKTKPVLPLGATGRLRGREYTIIGFMERFASYAGTIYPWTEYLLYCRGLGFRWLVNSDGHWTFAEPISPADLTHHAQSVSYDGQAFRLFDRGTATVRFVLGEFYWKVALGEQVQTSDYIAPPRMVSIERSSAGPNAEVNVSLGHHVPPEELEEAFDVELFRPWSVGPVQPRPNNKGVYTLWLAFGGVLLLTNLLFSAVKGSVDQWIFFYALLFISIIPLGLFAWNFQFEVNRWKESDYSPYAMGEE